MTDELPIFFFAASFASFLLGLTLGGLHYRLRLAARHAELCAHLRAARKITDDATAKVIALRTQTRRQT